MKNKEDRLFVLNRVAKSVVGQLRGNHPTHVFSYQGHPVTGICNSGWKRARVSRFVAGASARYEAHVWSTTARRGVPLETCKMLLGHHNGDITSHDSTPELVELIDAANKVCEGKSGKIPALMMLKQKTLSADAITA